MGANQCRHEISKQQGYNFMKDNVVSPAVLLAWAIGLTSVSVVAEASTSIYSSSDACAGYALSLTVGSSGCLSDARYGDPAISNASHGYINVNSDNSGGVNYAAQAAASGVSNHFGLYASASGVSSGIEISNPLSGASRSYAQISYSDIIDPTGLGRDGTTGSMVISWAVDGGVKMSGNSTARFGVGFCQMIPVGASTGGVGCAGYPDALTDTFTASNPSYSKTWNLNFPITYGVQYVLNTNFFTSASANSPGGNATSDFSNTGLMQPVQFYDSNGNQIYDINITSESGLDYLHPQAAVVPLPAATWLFGSGLLGLLGVARRKALRTA
jgi:hypothetical protein